MEKLQETESLDLTESFWAELAWLASLLWNNEWVAKIAAKELQENEDYMTVTSACVMTTNMDSILDKDEKFKQLSKVDKKNLSLIVNNWRWERLSEKYNSNENGCRKWIKSLIENIAKIS